MFKIKARKAIIIPLLPRRDTVLFPHMISQLLVRRPASIRALEEAWGNQQPIAIVARKDTSIDEITLDNLFPIGCEGIIAKLLRLPDGATTALVQGQRRLKLAELIPSESYFMVKAYPLEENTEKPLPTEALMRAVLALFEKCVKLSPKLSEEAYIAALNIDQPGWLADFIASNVEFTLHQRQGILESLDPHKRLEQISIFLAKELEVLEIQSKIDTKVREEVDKGQKEFFLREQLKAIQRELGESDPLTREINELKTKIVQAGMPETAQKKAQEEVERLSTMPQASPEVSVVRTYLDWLINLPWKKTTEDNLDIKQAKQVLGKNHYGLPKVKERILEYMAVRQLAGSKLRSPIICFVGPPGVGKTSLGKSIAQALGRKFVRLSLGGIRDEAEIRGHRRTYVGALPGRIIQTMRTAGTNNPVFMLDEIDKVGTDFRGDPSAALLEVLDPEQNNSFSDHYLDVPYNLSQVLFITTANIVEPIIPALKDRMEIIELPGYIEEEKLHIAKLFLVPKQLEEHGLSLSQLRFSDSSLRVLIREYTREAGVRNLEREIGGICRKVAKKVTEGDKAHHEITTLSLGKYLGPPKFFWGTAEEKNEIGVATGVARTEMGGDIISIEVTLMPGKGTLLLTGQLGEVMRESAQAALSFVRSRASGLGEFPFDKTDIHIHVPAGAVPKDGPSAGVTIATALFSALTRRPVDKDVAMTGEITLRGRVLPVGGIKEKVLAAHRAGIKTFIMPRKNERDLTEVPNPVRRELTFVLADNTEEILAKAIVVVDVQSPIPAGVR
ncbi:MAG: ATP-dependent protease La [Dehalococcoidia bacterium]|nr:ATP-dependent protease La [Dehalococcoidia bacterium]